MTLSSETLVPPQARCRWARIRAQDASGAKGRSLYRQPRRKPDAEPDATPHVVLGEAHGESSASEAHGKGSASVLAAVASIVLAHATGAAGAARVEEEIPIAKATVAQIDASPVTERGGASPPPLSPRMAAAACMCSLAPTACFSLADATPPSSSPPYCAATPSIPPPPPEQQQQAQEQQAQQAHPHPQQQAQQRYQAQQQAQQRQQVRVAQQRHTAAAAAYRNYVWPLREGAPAIGPPAAGTFGYAGSVPLQYSPAFFASPPLAAHTSYAPPPFATTAPFASATYANSAQFAALPLAPSTRAIGHPARSSWDDNMFAKWGFNSVRPPKAAPPPTPTSLAPPRP